MKNLIPFFIVLFVIIFISSCSEDKTLPNSKPAKTSYPSLSEKETDSTILIGTQVWMKKNLDVDHYRNGDTIPEVKDPKIWAKLKTGAWCYYGNSLDEGKIYGKLYNWFAVNDPRGLAPAGWHIPTDTEWTTLTSNLGGESGAGGKMKSKGTLEGDDGLWFRPNTGASNESGFSALPGGWRGYYGTFSYVGSYSHWWTSSSDSNSDDAWDRYLSHNNSNIFRYLYSKGYGFSVRCIKDN